MWFFAVSCVDIFYMSFWPYLFLDPGRISTLEPLSIMHTITSSTQQIKLLQNFRAGLSLCNARSQAKLATGNFLNLAHLLVYLSKKFDFTDNFFILKACDGRKNMVEILPWIIRTVRVRMTFNIVCLHSEANRFFYLPCFFYDNLIIVSKKFQKFIKQFIFLTNSCKKLKK